MELRMTGKLKICLIALLMGIPAWLLGQGDIEDLLYQEVDNLNPVYKPVMGFGIGMFNFYGEVHDPDQSPLMGTPGYKVNVATFVDNNQYLRANFYAMYGSLSGHERSASDLTRNLNFKTDLLLFGININYDFDNFYKTYRSVHPFVSVGFEMMTFNSKVDSFTTINNEEVRYHYWADGSIRNMPYSPANAANPGLRTLELDGKYETSLRDADWGMGSYPEYTFSIPVDAGLDFWVSNRVLFRVGASYHFVFTDLIDHVSSENTSGVIGKKGKDNFLFTYASIHLDLFSSKKTLAMQKLFADVDLDLTLIGDDDNDGYMDGWDQCPNTPFGVATDTTGCPFDDDYDGIPNFQDDEPHSRYGAYVDDRGVEMSEEDLIARLDMSSAVDRRDVPLYLRTPESYSSYRQLTAQDIPEKFRNVDSDGDGYISFDEILDAIDTFFDFESNLSSEDIAQ